MSPLIAVTFLAVAVFVFLFWLLKPNGNVIKNGSPLDPNVEGLFPVHYQHLPQILRALSASDEQYLRTRAPAKVAQQAMDERRAVARQFLAGLLSDFSNLERLARMIAALSPAISRKQETERLILGLKFRVFYALAWLRLSTGALPMRRIEDLTNLVGQLANRMEQAMAAVGALSSEGLSTRLTV